MKLRHEDVSQLYRRQTRAPTARPDCPSNHRLLLAARGGASTAERRTVAEHMAVCSTCADIYLAEKRAPAAPIASRPIAGPRRLGPSSRRRLYRAAQLAAVLTLCAGFAGWWLRQSVTSHTEVSRGEATLAVNASIDPADEAHLITPPTHLRWRTREDATYQAVLFDHELGRLWQSPELKAAEIELSESLRSQMTPGTAFYWRVIVRVGIERHESPLHRFHIVAPENP